MTWICTEKSLKKLIKQVLPPFLFNIYKAFYGRGHEKYGWFGNFNSWNEALELCSGYDSDIILQKVSSSLLKVKNNEAVYERDGVLFDQIEYSWPLIAALLHISSENNGSLNVLDFGGSFGSTYFQNKEFLKNLTELKWNIIEQPKFVDKGKKFFEDETLKFYYSVDEYLTENNCSVIILSSVIQYLEKPEEFIKMIISKNFKNIIFDRTSFVAGEKSKITIQRVAPEIYDAVYPCWYFNEKEILNFFNEEYKLIFDFVCKDNTNIQGGYFKGFYLKTNF